MRGWGNFFDEVALFLGGEGRGPKKMGCRIEFLFVEFLGCTSVFSFNHKHVRNKNYICYPEKLDKT